MKINFQFYKKYKLPITINPLEYGKLIFNIDNINIISITPKTIAVITQFNEINEVKFFRNGDFIFSYKDYKLDDNHFTRKIKNKTFTFKNNVLIETTITLES
uniref:Uncharacterized protein n=1 Tax=Russula subnigricans TaxID=258989 RepID=A0A649WI18_9AGAM|nr:hypothetical protein [Russula subnigricans]QGK88078.1 hypothetical protein [Russula subnigricans]